MSNTKDGSNKPPLKLGIKPCILINGITNGFFKLGAGSINVYNKTGPGNTFQYRAYWSMNV